jgi:hypothetical protein
MKLTKQQLIKVIKEELGDMLAEQFDPTGEASVDVGPESTRISGVHIVPTGTGFSRSTLGPPMAPEEPKYAGAPRDGGIPVVWDGPLAYPDPRFVRDFSTYEQDVEAGRAAPSWEEAREAADTGWGWGSLEEAIDDEARPDFQKASETYGTIFDTFPAAAWSVGADVPGEYLPGGAQPSWEEAVEDAGKRKRFGDQLAAAQAKRAAQGAHAPGYMDPRTIRALLKAREAGETGWGPGSLEETIQFELASLLKELK